MMEYRKPLEKMIQSPEIVDLVQKMQNFGIPEED